MFIQEVVLPGIQLRGRPEPDNPDLTLLHRTITSNKQTDARHRPTTAIVTCQPAPLFIGRILGLISDMETTAADFEQRMFKDLAEGSSENLLLDRSLRALAKVGSDHVAVVGMLRPFEDLNAAYLKETRLIKFRVGNTPKFY